MPEEKKQMCMRCYHEDQVLLHCRVCGDMCKDCWNKIHKIIHK